MTKKIKPSPAFSTALAAAYALKSAGHETYFVGGAVRDGILDVSCSKDVDIATSAKPAEIKKILINQGFDLDVSGQRFGSFRILGDGQAEVTSFRSEGGYTDKRHPDKVEFITDHGKDACRRDFTVNAIYMDPLTSKLSDPVGGIPDLRAKLVRLIGNPKTRIDEDHLRMLRAVRLASQLKFKLEKNTFAAIKTRAKLIQTVGKPRIKSELDKILLSADAERGVELLDEIGLLRFVLPELESLKNVRHKSKRYHLEGDVFRHSVLAFSVVATRCDLELSYAALLHDIGKATTGVPAKTDNGTVIKFPGHEKESVRLFKNLAKRLNFPRNQASAITWLIGNHQFWPEFDTLPFPEKVGLVLHPWFPRLLTLWEADRLSNLDRYPDGTVGPCKTKAIQSARKLFLLAQKKKPLLDKLFSKNIFSALTDMLPGSLIGNMTREIRIAIMKNEISSEKQLRSFVQNRLKKT